MVARKFDVAAVALVGYINVAPVWIWRRVGGTRSTKYPRTLHEFYTRTCNGGINNFYLNLFKFERFFDYV